MNLQGFFWVSVACVLLAGGGAQPQYLIVGKWQAADGSGDSVEFLDDGVVAFVADGRTFHGHYKFERDTVIEFTLDSPIRQINGFQAERNFQVPKVTALELVITDPNGQRKTNNRGR